MGAGYQGEVVAVVEAFYYVGAEKEACAAGGEAPAVDLVGVRPEEVAHGAFVGDFLFPVQEPDFIDCVYER